MSTPTSGKRIYELESMTALAIKPTALIVVAQDNLTRSVAMGEVLKYLTSEDSNVDPDKFYTAEKVDSIETDLIKRINNVSNNMSGFNQQLENLSADLNSKINGIYQSINLINNDIDNINKTLALHGSQLGDLVIRDQELQSSIDDVNLRCDLLDEDIDRIDLDIDNLQNADFEINNRIDNLIKYGTEIPTVDTCPVGHLYVQIF